MTIYFNLILLNPHNPIISTRISYTYALNYSIKKQAQFHHAILGRPSTYSSHLAHLHYRLFISKQFEYKMNPPIVIPLLAKKKEATAGMLCIYYYLSEITFN